MYCGEHKGSRSLFPRSAVRQYRLRATVTANERYAEGVEHCFSGPENEEFDALLRSPTDPQNKKGIRVFEAQPGGLLLLDLLLSRPLTPFELVGDDRNRLAEFRCSVGMLLQGKVPQRRISFGTHWADPFGSG
jgi:hypothetical protein